MLRTVSMIYTAAAMKKENIAKIISPQVRKDIFMCPTANTATAPINVKFKQVRMQE